MVLGENDRGHSQEVALLRQEEYIKGNCPKYKIHDQSSEITEITIVMVVDDSDVLLVASTDEKSD